MLHDEQRNKRRNNNKIILRVHKLTVKLKKTVTLINSDRLFFLCLMKNTYLLWFNNRANDLTKQ